MMLPPIAERLGKPFKVGGGWMYSSLKRLMEQPDIDIAVATVYDGNDLIYKQIDSVRYYLLPLKNHNLTKYNPLLEKDWLRVRDEFNPDIVHIHGSEYPHGLAYVKATKAKNIVVSIQGLVSKYTDYYLGGISTAESIKYLSFCDFIKGNSLLQQKKQFNKRGRLEIELLKRVTHIIGRTEWDRTNTWSINPAAHYHHCGETLRDEFYKHKWRYESCTPYSIFISQAGYPIKGFHKLLDAIALILPFYPNTHIYVPGTNILNLPWYKISSYGNYLKAKIKRLNIEKHITFLGPLNEEEMCKQFLKCNVFICPSIIENSPNTLGEAQLLGVPYLSSICGGTPELCGNNYNNLYRFEETATLAYKVCKIFEAKEDIATTTFDIGNYDGKKNLEQLLNAYNSIVHGS